MTTRRALDVLAARAFPATEAEDRDGWLLRASPGVAPRRGNSALPPVEAGPAAAIDVVEAWYAARGLPPTVMVSPAEEQGRLDALLAARGWPAFKPTDVLVAGAAEVRARLGEPSTPMAEGDDLSLFPEPVRSSVYARIPEPWVVLAAPDRSARALIVLQDG